MSQNYQYLGRKVILLLVLPLLWISPVQSMEQVAFKTSNGDIQLADLKGQVVYVDFWASWCKPCRKSFPWMNNLQKRFANKGLKIIAVNVDKDKALVEQFLKAYPAGFTVAYDAEGELARKFNVKGMPSSFIFDRGGKLMTSHIGFRKKEIGKLESIIEKELSHKN